MKSVITVVLAFLLPAAAALAADGGAVILPWFSENEATFRHNVDGKWRYDSRVAGSDKGKIVVYDLSDDPDVTDAELRYVPSAATETERFMVGEMTVSFDEIGDAGLASKGGFAGVQLVDGGAGADAVFAVLNPMQGDASWLVTDVSARLRTDYVIRYEIGRISGIDGKCVRYSYRLPGESSYQVIAAVPLLPAFSGLGEIAYVGGGTVTSVDFAFKGGDEKSLTMDITDVSVSYGVDFTNASVKIKVENFWRGDDYDGAAYAHFLVYDSEGRLIDTSGAGGVPVTGDGVYEIGLVGLPEGAGNDYRFRVEVVTEDDAHGTATTVEATERDEAGVHIHSGWFHETAETFALGGRDGRWTSPEGAAVVTNGALVAVDTGDSAGKVKFTPTDDITNDLVKVEIEAVFDGASQFYDLHEPEAVSHRLAGLTIVEIVEGSSSRLSYAVWAPDESAAGGRFVPVSGTSAPALGRKCRVSWTINYRAGYVSYAVDGESLCDANGRSCFAIPESADCSGKSVACFGKGLFGDLDGDQYNANLASRVVDGVTNEYATVDEAVAAALKGDGKVSLLWDASWRPDSADVGRTVHFDVNGHELFVDPATTNRFARQGYRVIDNGDGSYTIGVINYYLSFDMNGDGEGEMPDQPYSVTNMVFALAENAFTREGFNFVQWNEQADGTGPTNWEDGAVIDMTPYGLTNMTLFAQWKVAIRTIIIEAAEEFVYIERVLTNGIDNAGVRYFCEDATKATGRAEVPVDNGSEFMVLFSTDLEKVLTFQGLKATTAITASGTVTTNYLPRMFVEGVTPILSPIQEWALSKGIDLAMLAASRYSKASYALNVNSLLNESSRVEISEFVVLPRGFSFKLTIDGEQLTDPARVADIIRVSSDIAAEGQGWHSISKDGVSAGDGGTIVVTTGDNDCFVKIVIPTND